MFLSAIRFCPCCAAPLTDAGHGGAPCRRCQTCGFRYYREPKVSVIGRVQAGPRLLFIQRAVDPGLGQWGFPGGFLNVDEMPEDALIREVREETALAIEVRALLGVYPMEGRGAGIPGIVLAYDAACLDDPNAARAGDDAGQVLWCDRNQVPAPLAFASTRRLVARWQAEGAASGLRFQGNGTSGAGKPAARAGMRRGKTEP